ncbi:50S ribosomal protein L25 [Thermaerobacter subterraneus]|uniref:Large ribosomal subunit protein bL25 n=1 Tax=Thermaerobacter subterraneus DSM 13965 TaxID=867903 RepID=K6PP83_9FIRM|nr:50S ribosomal protein L25 [Thermaerobacter subterraneus]EKP94722.1 LSU ribosomal protein L25P [Thermaerobacter subterraneus DSM 13965]
MQAVLRAVPREPGHARRVRREGGLPAVLYGPSGNFPVRLDAREFHRLLASGRARGILTVELVQDGSTRSLSAMVKELQYHPARGDLLHVDLFEVREDEPVRAEVPIVLRGVEEAEKRGILQHQLAELEIESLPRHMPAAVEGDVARLPVGEELRVRDLEVPAQVRVLNDPDEIVAVLLPPKDVGAEEEAQPAAEAAAGAATDEKGEKGEA